MPAAAVIPAPVAYIKVAAVKKLVVGFLVERAWPASIERECRRALAILLENVSSFTGWIRNLDHLL